MAKCAPFHTNTEEYGKSRNVHHDHDDCYEGKKIKKEHRVENSTGGKPRCSVCDDIAKKEDDAKKQAAGRF